MPQRSWSTKRERQYEHLKQGLLERGESRDTADAIAARTIESDRARHGDARRSLQGVSSARRGAVRASDGDGGPTYDQLYNEAKKRNIPGRSKMSKTELERALGGRR